MDKAKPLSQDAREFFATELRTTMERQHLSANPESVDYLVNLLVYYMESQVFFRKDEEGRLQNNVLADLYAQYMHGNVEAKKAALRRLGDICLLVSGFFSDSLKRKLVDVDYYLGMGGTAYGQLAQFHMTDLRSLYSELSTKFRPFSDVLGEMSERSGLQSNRDILRIYERWLLTGNDRLKVLLSEHGIKTPLRFDNKVKH